MTTNYIDFITSTVMPKEAFENKKVTHCRCTIPDTDTELKKLKADLIIFK